MSRCCAKTKGYLTRTKNYGSRPARFVNRSLKRGTATHVAVIASQSEVQAVLPQIVLVNKRIFKASDVPIESENVKFWRDNTSWNTAEKMVSILKQLSNSIDKFKAKYQFVLLLDMAPQHLDLRVIAQANSENLWPLFVPAKMPCFLQPLDVSALQAYKAGFNAILASKQQCNGDLATADWTDAMKSMSKHFWRARTWRSALEAVGLLSKVRISEELRNLCVHRNAELPMNAPAECDVQVMWPKRKKVPYSSLFLLPAKLEPPELF